MDRLNNLTTCGKKIHLIMWTVCHEARYDMVCYQLSSVNTHCCHYVTLFCIYYYYIFVLWNCIISRSKIQGTTKLCSFVSCYFCPDRPTVPVALTMSDLVYIHIPSVSVLRSHVHEHCQNFTISKYDLATFDLQNIIWLRTSEVVAVV